MDLELRSAAEAVLEEMVGHWRVELTTAHGLESPPWLRPGAPVGGGTVAGGG